ncbi:MAG: hypothetical protein ABIK09_05935 [Pseudomonadota bacterium]
MKSAMGVLSLVLGVAMSLPSRAQPVAPPVTEVVTDKIDTPALRVELVAKVHLANFMMKEGRRSIPLGSGLSGRVQATVTNTSPDPVVIEDLEVSNLVFIDVETGTEHVMVHPCAVMAACGPDQNQGRHLVTLAPGQSHVATVDEFGCSGSMWKAPPPGQYHLRYRFRVSPLETIPEWCGPEGDAPAPESIAAARRALATGEFWRGSAVSAPFEIDLRKVRTDWVK